MEIYFKDQPDFANFVIERFAEAKISQKELVLKLDKSRSAISLALSEKMKGEKRLNKLRFEILDYLGIEAGKAIFVKKK